jgi:hypothetical protein
MDIKYFVSTIHRDNGAYTKGVAIKVTPDEAQQAFHNEFTAWAFGKVQTCDYVCAYIHDSNGAVVRPPEVWKREAEEVAN